MQNIALTIQTWYTQVNKPFWAPPMWAFDVIWATIYPLIVLTFSYVFWLTFIKRQWHWAIGILFAVNLILNLTYAIGIYTTFASAQQVADFQPYYWYGSALALATFLTLLPIIAITWKKERWISICLLPYLIWITLATLLQVSIAIAN